MQLYLDLVAFFFGSLKLADENVLVDLDLLFALFHRHFKLVLPVLEAVDFVSARVNFFAQTLNL